MRIGIDISAASGWRGPSRNVRNLIRGLAEQGARHEFFWFHPFPMERIDHHFDNVKVVHVPLKRGVPWLNVTLPRAIRENKLNAFLFPGSDFWFWRPLPTVVMTRTYKIVAWDQSLLERLRALIKTRMLNRVADAVCAVSRYNADQVVSNCKIDRNKVEVVYNAVDPVFADPTVRPCAVYGDYILYCGGTEQWKNIDGLLAAYRIIAARAPGVRLVLVGGKYGPVGDAMAGYQGAINALGIQGRVVIHGIERDARTLAGLYRGAGLVVFPSFHESFGMVSVEAMASGVPLVASNVAAIPEIAGDAALYFDPRDPSDIAAKIEQVMNDRGLRDSLIAKGRERVRRFDWRISARKMLAVLSRVGAG